MVHTKLVIFCYTQYSNDTENKKQPPVQSITCKYKKNLHNLKQNKLKTYPTHKSPSETHKSKQLYHKGRKNILIMWFH